MYPSEIRTIEPLVVVAGHVIGTLEHVSVDDEGVRLYRIVDRVPVELKVDVSESLRVA